MNGGQYDQATADEIMIKRKVPSPIVNKAQLYACEGSISNMFKESTGDVLICNAQGVPVTETLANSDAMPTEITA